MSIQRLGVAHDDDPESYLVEKINEVIDVVNKLTEPCRLESRSDGSHNFVAYCVTHQCVHERGPIF